MFRPARESAVILLATLACAISACATSDIVRKTSAPAPPAWITTTPSDPSFLYFIGSVAGLESLEKGRDAALAMATNQVAQYIGVNVSALGTFVSSTNAADRKAEEQTTASATGTIQGAEIAGTYYESTTRQVGQTQIDRFDVWTLVRFPRDAADAERSRQKREKKERAAHALDLLTQARLAKSATKLSDAARALRDAKKELSVLQTEVEMECPEFRSSSELSSAVNECLSDVVQAMHRSAVAATETMLGKPSTQSMAALGLSGVLTKKGFPVLPSEPAPAGETPEQAEARAHAAGAAILIRLESSVVRTGMLYGSPVCTARVQVQALDTTTHEVLATAERNGKGVKANEAIAAEAALTEAGEAAGQALAKAMLDREQAHP